MQERAEEAKAALDSSAARVAEASQRLETLDQQYDAIAGQDNNGAFTKAIELMAENDSRDDVRRLYREAARTKTDADRVIVEKIDRLTQSIARADEEIAQIRGQIREVAARRVEIEQARREFRQRDYDYPGAAFGNETTINDVLGGILHQLPAPGAGSRVAVSAPAEHFRFLKRFSIPWTSPMLAIRMRNWLGWLRTPAGRASGPHIDWCWAERTASRRR